MLRRLSLFLVIPALLMACNPDRIKYTNELKQEMADKRVKRVTNADLTDAVNSWGGQIVAIAEGEAATKLAAGEPAAGVCTLQELPKTQALAKRYGIEISLLRAPDVQSTKLAQKEREVLDAYLYNAENKLPQSSNIQPIGDSMLVYNAAVPVSHPLCTACANQQKDALAVWRLAFPKREIVRNLKIKK